MERKEEEMYANLDSNRKSITSSFLARLPPSSFSFSPGKNEGTEKEKSMLN
jgi:hypothetical protein